MFLFISCVYSHKAIKYPTLFCLYVGHQNINSSHFIHSFAKWPSFSWLQLKERNLTFTEISEQIELTVESFFPECLQSVIDELLLYVINSWKSTS